MTKTMMKNILLSQGCMITYNLNDPDSVTVIKPEEVKELEKQYRKAVRELHNKPDPFLEQIRIMNSLIEKLSEGSEQYSFKQSCIV